MSLASWRTIRIISESSEFDRFTFGFANRTFSGWETFSLLFLHEWAMACGTFSQDVGALPGAATSSRATEGLDERFGLVVDIHINELQLVVHDCDTKAVHFNEPSIPFLSFVASSEVPPVTPGERHPRRGREDLQDLPGEGGKGAVEFLM